MALPSLGSSHIIIPNDHSHPQGSLSGLTTHVSARVSSLHWHKLPFPRAHHITSSNSDLRAGKAFGKSCWLGETGSTSLPKPKLDLLPKPLQSLCTNGLREMDGKVCTGIHKSLVEKIPAAPGEATYLAMAAVNLHLHCGCFICM